MPLLHCQAHSIALGVAISFDVILPHPRPRPGATQHFDYASGAAPVLYLLHGLSDDHTIWQRRTSIERYVEPLNLAVVMPAVNRSFHTDMTHGARYWTFISEELPALVHHLFRLSDARDDTFVAGLSMGGYGAFKLALSHPERFAAAAALSGALDVVRVASDEANESRGSEWAAEMQAIFGNPSALARSDRDLFHLAERLVASKGPQPMLYQACGTADFLYEDNLRFLKHARRIGLDIRYEEGAAGHEWAYWDEHIRKVIDWLPLRERAAATASVPGADQQ